MTLSNSVYFLFPICKLCPDRSAQASAISMSPGRDKLVRKRGFLALNNGDSWVSHQVFLPAWRTGSLLPGQDVCWGVEGGFLFLFFFLQGMAPNPPARNPARVSRALNAVRSALSPTKSPLLSICKQLNSACIMCEPAMPVPRCALPCSQPSTPAAQALAATAVIALCHHPPCCSLSWRRILGVGRNVY